MTPEEFYGHIMALLSGPRATEVAGKIFDVATNDPELIKSLSDLINVTARCAEDSLHIKLLTHVNALLKKRVLGENARDKALRDMKLYELHDAFMVKIRESQVRELRSVPNGAELARRVMLDMETVQ